MMNLAKYVLEGGTAYGVDRPAILFQDQIWSYGELFEEIAKLAAVLHKLGVGRGDRVMAHMANRPEYYVTYLAAAHVGAICATVNIDYTTVEVAHMVRHAQPRCIVADREGALKITQMIESAQLEPVGIVRVDRSDDSGSYYGQLACDAKRVPFAEMNGDEGVLLCYTSGSSGMPKPVLTTHAGEIWAARSFRSMWRLTWNDKVIVSLPLAWVYGLGTLSVPALSGGATVVLLSRFRPDTVCEAIAAHRATVFAGVTTMYRMIVEYAKEQATPPDLRSLRFSMTGGERRNEAAFEKFEALSGIPVHDLYASSEARPILGYDPIVAKRPIPGSAGVLFPGVEARLEDEAGNPVPLGEVGELIVRSPNTFKEYFREPEMTADKVTADGWVKTGDLFHVSDDGYWYIHGRRDADMINRSGAKVSPAEVEAHLIRHPKIKEAIVIGRPDRRYGEEVVACVVGTLAQEGALATVQAHCKGVLADYKIPTHVMLLPDMPYGNTGKIDRKALVRLAAQIQ